MTLQYSNFDPMKKLLLFILLTAGLTACHKEVEPGCDTLATVTDLSSTGGCGFGFTLEDGTIVIAEQRKKKCGHQHSDPLSNFTLVDGMKVKIGYEIEHHHSSSCPAGTVVEVNCIEQIISSEKK